MITVPPMSASILLDIEECDTPEMDAFVLHGSSALRSSSFIFVTFLDLGVFVTLCPCWIFVRTAVFCVDLLSPPEPHYTTIPSCLME
jgi:hypothetical protein